MKKNENVKKQQLGDKLIFPTSMYNTVWGSVLICGYIFSEQPINTNNLKCKWLDEERKILKGKKSKLEDFHPSDEGFIDDVLEYFGMKRPDNFPIALIRTPFNVLFVPYVDGRVLPLREDGLMGRTLRCFTELYPVEFNDKVYTVGNNVLEKEEKEK